MRNGSESAIYDVTVWLVDAKLEQVGDRYSIEIMKPHEERSCKVNVTDIGSERLRLVFTFRDPAANCWRRNSEGFLEEVSKSAKKEGLRRSVGRKLQSP